MKRLSFMSIRSLLMLIVFIGALPAALITIFSYLNLRSGAINEARIETQRLADGIASEQQNLIAAAQQLVGTLAQLPELKNHDAARLQPILAEIVRVNSQYVNLSVADLNGTVWATAVPTSLPFSISDRRHFKSALATGQFSSGEYIISRAAAKPMLSFGYPFKSADGVIAGVISVGFNLDKYRKLLERSRLPFGSSYALIDYNGMILSRGIDPAPYIGKKDSPERMKQLLEGPDSATFIGPGLDGVQRFTSIRKIRLKGEETPYMYVRAGMPVDIVLKQAKKAALQSMAVFLSFLIFALCLALLIAKYAIADRVSLLEKASERLAKGDLHVRISDLVAGGELGSLGRSFDSMARQLALREQALVESERNYREIFNATKDAIFVLDPVTGGIVEANKTAKEMYGYTRAELLHLTIQDISSGEPPYSLKEAIDLMQTMLHEGTQSFQWLSKRKNGEGFWTEVLLSTTHIGGEVCALAVSRDISERKDMDRLKDEMISAVNHEIRTPLTAILGYVDFILQHKVDEAQVREFLGIVYKETERLKDLVNTFLDMQRLSARQGAYSLSKVEVAPLLLEAGGLFAGASTKHRIVTDIAPDLPPVLSDDKCLHQVLNNLLSNAVKYSPNGGEVVLGARPLEGTVTIWIKDEGIGIPQEALEKIFDRFYRVDNTARRTTSGTGLGLALVREIVAAHGGSIRVESTVGKGSTFYVTFPAAKSADAGT